MERNTKVVKKKRELGKFDSNGGHGAIFYFSIRSSNNILFLHTPRYAVASEKCAKTSGRSSGSRTVSPIDIKKA